MYNVPLEIIKHRFALQENFFYINKYLVVDLFMGATVANKVFLSNTNNLHTVVCLSFMAYLHL